MSYIRLVVLYPYLLCFVRSLKTLLLQHMLLQKRLVFHLGGYITNISINKGIVYLGIWVKNFFPCLVYGVFQNFGYKFNLFLSRVCSIAQYSLGRTIILQIFLKACYLQKISGFDVVFNELFCNIELFSHICKKSQNFFAYITKSGIFAKYHFICDPKSGEFLHISLTQEYMQNNI